ncbi:MAG: polyphosphate polymerase domain-containing protein [Sphaerochaetaceae bacterium]
MENKSQTFKRKEMKFLIDKKTKDSFFESISSQLDQDAFGQALISNIYYDDINSRLIRRSLEKPAYKEKLRLRSYNNVNSDSKVFIELKKKYDGIVYKRRLSMKETDAEKFLNREINPKNQIEKETRYFLDFYHDLKPAMYLSYNRLAYFCKSDPNLRITFDSDILYRTENLSLLSKSYGSPLLEKNLFIMEIKCADAMPLWLVEALNKNKIYQSSFSKYGNAYLKNLTKDNISKGSEKIA